MQSISFLCMEIANNLGNNLILSHANYFERSVCSGIYTEEALAEKNWARK